MSKTLFNLYLPDDELLKDVVEEAKKNNKSTSEWIRQAMEEKLERDGDIGAY